MCFVDNISYGRCTLWNADCKISKFEKVYLAKFHLLNVPQITPLIFSAFDIPQNSYIIK